MLSSQAAQTYVTREVCNVIYIPNKPPFPSKSLTSALSRSSFCLPNRRACFQWGYNKNEESVPWIEVPLEWRLGKGLLIIWPTTNLLKFWNLLQLSFFEQLNKKSQLTFLWQIVPLLFLTSAVHHFSFKWDIAHVVKAAAHHCDQCTL